MLEAGFTTYGELKTRNADGSVLITAAEILDLNEILVVRHENDRRSRRASERSRKSKRNK